MIYCYRLLKDNKLVEVPMTVAEMERRERGDGSITLPEGEAVRDLAAEHQGFHQVSDRAWPILSEAAGVHKAEIPKAMEEARQHGVNMNFTPDGRAIFESRRQQRKYLRTIGMHNNDDY